MLLTETRPPHCTLFSPRIFKPSAACSATACRLSSQSDMQLVPLIERGLQRRAAVRYKLRLPVIFHWNNGRDHTEGGFTADVALDGAFILSTKCPPIGSDVRIEVLLPSPDESGGEMRIECEGKVTRVVSEPGCNGFGVRGIFDDDHLTRQVHL